MKSLKVQVIEFFLDHLMRQHHEIERDLTKKLPQPNVVQMYTLDNYRNTFREQIRLGRKIGLSTDDMYELTSLSRKDEVRQFANFTDMGVGRYLARVEFGGAKSGSLPARYDIFHYKEHYLLSVNSAAGHQHFRVAAGDDLVIPFFFDFCLREEFGKKGLENVQHFRPVLVYTEEEFRREMSGVFTGFVHQHNPDADDLALLFSLMASETDFPFFEQQLRANRDLYEGAGADAFTLLKLARPDPERITFGFIESQLAAWLESLSIEELYQLTGLLFMTLSRHYLQE